MRELHCRHSDAAHIHTHTLCVSANDAGEQNFRYVQPDCVNNRPVKQYIVRGPFATASQITQNNKPKLTKRCTRVLLRRLHVLFPINEAVRSALHSNYSFFAWNNNIPLVDIFICKIFVLFFVLNVKNYRLDATLIIIIFFGRVYRCNFNFNFRAM